MLDPIPRIRKNDVVSLDMSVLDLKGAVVDSSGDRPKVYLHGGYFQIPPVVEKLLDGLALGDGFSILLEPEDAYGDYDPALVIRRPASELNSDAPLELEMEFDCEKDEDTLYRVVAIDGDEVTLDGNHAWAGRRFRFVVKVLAIRPATEEELKHPEILEE